MTGDWPSIDHSFLSPSGHMSKRSREAYLKRLSAELFTPEIRAFMKERCPQPTEKESLLNQAKRLRDLANSGMNTRKYNREADKLEAQAALL